MRARVHDEAALLPDQAVDIGRVQPDGLRLAHHGVAVRHGKALREVDEALGALAGVDAAVPHLVLAGQVGGGVQLAVGLAAGAVQVGPVVPFAHAFAAQAQGNRQQAAVQANVAARPVALGLCQRRRRGRRGDGTAQLFLRQLFIEAAKAGDAFQQLARLGAVEVAARLRQLGAGQPVGPGRVAAGLVAHGLHGVLHGAPLALAQRGAHLPGQQVVAQVVVARDLGEVAGRALVQLQRGGFADDAPDPVALFGRQLAGPAAFHLRGGLVGVGRGQLDERQRHQLLPLARDHGQARRQVADRAALDLRHLGAHVRRVQLDGGACQRGAVGLDGQARLLPQILVRQLARLVQRASGQQAAVVQVALGEPVGAHLLGRLGRHGAALVDGGGHGVAAHLAVVAHAELRVVRVERGPVAPLARHQQPVVAQAVFLVGVGIARHEVLHLQRAGFFQPRLQFPVGGPGLQRVAARLRQQRRQARAVVAAEGLAHVQDHAVAGRGAGNGRRRHRRGRCHGLDGLDRLGRLWRHRLPRQGGGRCEGGLCGLRHASGWRQRRPENRCAHGAQQCQNL